MCRNLNAACSQVNMAFIANAQKDVNNLCMETILDRVEIRIRQLGLSWADFARLLDTTDQRVHNWKKRGVPKSEVDHIADVLECSTDWLLRGTAAASRVEEPRVGYSAPRIRSDDFDLVPPEPEMSSPIREELLIRPSKAPEPEKRHPGIKDMFEDELEFFGRMDAWDSNTPLDEDEVELPLFREVELAAGAGQTQVVENHGAKLRFAKSTLSRASVLPENAACAFVRGNSMEPVMPDGTCVGVNTADKTIRDGEIYAIDHDGMLRVKYLHRRPGGGIKIVSQNSSEHPVEELTADEMAASVRVIGRVFWWSVLR